jgi:hypothetical protein
MGHIKYRSTTRAEATPVEWLSVGAQIGQLANIWAARGDLIAYVGPGAGGAAPACYTPATAEVEINVDVAFGRGATPADIGDLRDRDNQYMWPKAAGAIFHEALHARFSTWNMESAFNDLEPAEFRALVLLEEGRIEANGTRLFPENAGFLRSCALEIVLADIAEQPIEDSDSRVAAQLAALTMARVDAGVLDESDVAMLADVIVAKLGVERVRALRDLWLAAQEYSRHNDITGLYDVAREWVRIVEEAAKENGEPEASEESGMATPGGEGSGASAEFTKSVMEALSEAAENATIGSFEQLSEQQTSEEWESIAKDRSSAAKQESEHKSVADDVFGQGTGPMPDTDTRSRLSERRQPTGPERAAAVKIANMLEKAKYRDRDETEIHSIVPPGRLRTRAMVQGAALKSKGVMAQVEPWRRTVRKHVDDPTLTIGVMVDISGSMGDAMQPMATTAWVMSEAVRRVQGRSAMVYYGQDVFPTLKPGQHLTEVNVYTAPDGTEKFNKAFKALDGSLNLLNGTGARLLVIVSDGCYVDKESQAARKWLAACQAAGVGVLWMPFDGRDRGRTAIRLTAGTSAVVLTDTMDPAAAATEIGTAAARALTAVS